MTESFLLSIIVSAGKKLTAFKSGTATTPKSYKSFEKTNFYTIHKKGEEFNETDNFFLRFKDDPKHIKDIEIIKYWIQKIG